MIQECDRISSGRKTRRGNPPGGFVEHFADGKFQAALIIYMSHYRQLAAGRPIRSLGSREKFTRGAAIERNTSQRSVHLHMVDSRLGPGALGQDGKFSLRRNGKQRRV